MNVITIYENDILLTTIKASDDSLAAYALWRFLVEHLKPGLTVEIDTGERQLSMPSGELVQES